MKMNTTLLIIVAGIGNRFRTEIKQLEPVDDAGHIIMDYSIHDAIEAEGSTMRYLLSVRISRSSSKRSLVTALRLSALLTM